MANGESKRKVLGLALLVSAIVILGSIALVRSSNRNRGVTPAILMAASDLASIPDSLVMGILPQDEFNRRRSEFAGQLIRGSLPVDSARGFYQSYALWARDGRWDTSDVRQLGLYLGITGNH